MRIMHLFEEGEDPEFSKPVSVDLKVPPSVLTVSMDSFSLRLPSFYTST